MVLSQLKMVSRSSWIVMALVYSTTLFGGGSSLGQVILKAQFQETSQERVLTLYHSDQLAKHSQKKLAAFGLLLSFDSDQKLVHVTSKMASRISPKEKFDSLQIESPFPIDLEGESQFAIKVVSSGVRIIKQWSSPRLTLVPRKDFDPHHYSTLVAPSGVLRIQFLHHSSGKFINEGKISSDESLELKILEGSFENRGMIESQKDLVLVAGTLDQKSTFTNLGKVIAPHIKMGSLLKPLQLLQNGNEKSAVINAKTFFANVGQFINSGEILASEKIVFSGVKWLNKYGSIHSGGSFFADFDQFNNNHGSLSGHLRTQLQIRKSLSNEEGEIGSISLTELGLKGAVRAESIGKVHGTDVRISSNHQEPITLSSGDLYGENSISIISESKILMPTVQIHTPLLNLSVPDFALDQQADCGITVVHCKPSKDFNLTSPYCSQGSIVFLQSDFKVPSEPLKQESSVILTPAKNETSLSSLEKQYKKSLVTLNHEIDQTAVYFERNQGRASKFKVSLKADLKSEKNVGFIAPLANLYLGDRDNQVGIEAGSFRAWANFLFLINGHVAAQDALVKAPGGLRIGTLTEQSSEQVRVGSQSFPLFCRNGSIWATQNQTQIHGPLNCDGRMEIGGNLIVDSEKDQWSYSPEIRVKGDLAFQGSGNFNVVRHLGESQQSSVSLLTSRYSVPGRVQVDHALTSEKPMTLGLYSTVVSADEILGDFSVEEFDSTGNQEIQFPGELPTRHFHALLSGRKGGVVRLKGKNNQGVIASPQLFLIEKKGEFFLGTKNPYYLEPKSPLQDLMKKGFEINSVYLTEELQSAIHQVADYRFHFSLRERFFFNQTKSESFYNQIKEDVVIYKPGSGLIPLPSGKVVFSLSPEFLLRKVQDSCQENLMRGYLYDDRPISLELIAELHRNATEYLGSLGGQWTQQWSPDTSDSTWIAALQNPQNQTQLPKNPLIFYQEIVNGQGIEELKPFFYIPPKFLAEARAQQTGSVFAQILARFPEGTTADEMANSLPEESGVQKALVEFFKNNPNTKKAVTRAAQRALLSGASLEDSHEDVVNLNIPIRSPHFALMVDGDLNINTNQKGKSAAYISKKGSITLASTKSRTENGVNFNEQISDQRELSYEGHLEFSAGKDIRTTVVEINAGSLQWNAQGDIIDESITLESYSEKKAPRQKETEKRSRAEVSEFKVQNKFGLGGQNIALRGTNVEAGTIQLEAQSALAVVGVEETSISTKETKKDTGALFWKGTKTRNQTKSETQFKAASLKSRDAMGLKAENVTLQAPQMEASETEIEATKLRILQGKSQTSSLSMEKSENAFWVYVKSTDTKDESHTQAQFKGKVKLKVGQLELEQVNGHVLNYLDHLEYDPAQVEVVYKMLDELHHKKEKEISAPGPALIAAVALAASVATGGTGTAVVGAIGIKVASLIGTMISTAISSLAAQIATQLTLGILAQQSPGDIFNQIVRVETLRGMATSVISAGVMCEVGGLQEAAGASQLVSKLENAGAQAGTGLCTSVVFGEKNIGDALKSAGVQFVSQAAGSVISGQIGDHFKDKTSDLDRILHKAAHGASAAGISAAGAAVMGQDVTMAATEGAAGAMTSEIVADILARPLAESVHEEVKKQEIEQDRPLTLDEKRAIFNSRVEDVAKISKLTGAVSGLLTGSSNGVNTASSSASTAIDNNFLPTAARILWGTYLAYEAATTILESAQTSNSADPDAIESESALQDMFVLSAGHGALRTAKRAGPHVIEFLNQSKEGAKEFLATSKHLVGNEVGAVGPGVEKLIVKGETAGSRGVDSAGQSQAAKPVFEPNPKHGAFQNGRANPAPTNPQETLNNSVKMSENSSRRVAADRATGEFNVFDQHIDGKFHGHQRTWHELTESMKSALIKAKITNHKGKIL